MSSSSPYSHNYEVDDTGLAKPRPVPEPIRKLENPIQRQLAEDAWNAASRLCRLLDQWRAWFHELKKTGDADPGFALKLRWETRTCVRVLCVLGVIEIPESELLATFPEPPSGRLGFELRLMSALDDVSGIPTEGLNLIIVATVDQVLHFRIFDRDGKMVVDKGEKRLTERVQPIEDLRNQLESLWPPHELTGKEKDLVFTAVTSIVGHISRLDQPWQKDEGWRNHNTNLLVNLMSFEGELENFLRMLGSSPGTVILPAFARFQRLGDRKHEELPSDPVERAIQMLENSPRGRELLHYLNRQPDRKASLDKIAVDLDGAREATASRLRGRIRQRFDRARNVLERENAPVRLSISNNVIELAILKSPSDHPTQK
jgi:hypothetical protein